MPPPAIVILAVADLAASRAFYERAFAWPILVSTERYAEYDTGGLAVGLFAAAGFERHTGRPSTVAAEGETARAELYFRVADPAALLLRLQEAGAPVLSPLAARDWGEEVGYVLDPNGNVIAIAGLARVPST